MTLFTRSPEPEHEGEHVGALHAILTKLGYGVDKSEATAQRFGSSTQEAVRKFQQDNALPTTGAVDHRTAALLEERPVAEPPVAPGKQVAPAHPEHQGPPELPEHQGPPQSQRTVSGHLVFEYGLPASGVELRAYDRQYGKDELLVEGTSAADGSYSLTYRAADPVNLELRTLDSEKKEISLSQTTFGAGGEEHLDLVVPASVRPLAPEYDRLAADLQGSIGGIAALGRAQEGEGHEDLSVEHQRTSWDARLLALAAFAAQVSEKTKVPTTALYALCRIGMPTDPAQLARLHPTLVEKALERAVEAGLVGREDIKGAPEAIAAFARTQLKESTAPGAISSFGELLGGAGLTAAQEEQWEKLYFSTPPDQLWKAAEKELPAAAVETLRTQGRLAALTIDSAPLVKVLHEGAAKGGLPGLVDAGYYNASTWEATLHGLAGAGNVEALIPAAYAAPSTEDRLVAYAADMARKVRLAFPTRVVGHMLEAGELKLGAGQAAGALLKQASEKGFELARMPVTQAFTLAGGTQPTPEVKAAVKTVQRVFQITPSNEALGVMLNEGLHSARDVIALGHDRFVAAYGGKFTMPNEAELVWRKANQVHGVTHGLLKSARALDSSTATYAASGTERTREEAKANLLKQYPTMEELFGSLDFCECPECRSVLSPAAYLVDLLQFINQPQNVWDVFTGQWKSTHGGQDYGNSYYKPFDQLDKRRPDIKNLPLTCENTNTTLPYIDVVNEILEYSVAHAGEASETGNDTGEARSPELLAEPQYVLPAAYEKLLEATYPLTLPFDLWIATVRAFLSYFEVPLAKLLETFRATDELFAPTNAAGGPYYRYQIFVESLGLSPAEWALYTDDPAGSWWKLYGYKTQAEAEGGELSSAQALAIRLGVSYAELAELVETGFVNPALSKFVALAKIGIDVGDVYRYQNAADWPPMTAGERTAFEAQLKAFQSATGFHAEVWVGEQYASHAFDSILVLADPEPGCNFKRTKLQYANGNAATAVDLVKLNLFARLWRKLGWTIGEVDRALTALTPRNSSPLTAANMGPALATSLLYLAHLCTLVQQLALGESARLTLPTLWTDIPTTGPNSLYAQLFLTPSAHKVDPVFDNPVGEYLQDQSVMLKDHRAGVQAALTLSGRDVDAILADRGIDAETAPLSLANVSLLYRYGLLARGLGLSVQELVALNRLAGIDPFTPLAAEPLNANPALAGGVSPLEDDHPFSATLRFVELAREVAGSGFSIAECQYMLVHDAESVARFRPDESPALALMQALRTEIGRVRAENKPPDDPASLEDETLRQKLALILPGEEVDIFMAMWSGTMQYTASAAVNAPAEALDPTKLASFPISVAYDGATKEQRLTFTGALLGNQGEIESAYSPPPAAPSPLLKSLLDDVREQSHAFYAQSLERSLRLRPAAFEAIFAPIPAGPAQAVQQALDARRTEIVRVLYPRVQERVTEQVVVTSLAATLAADPTLIESLVSESALLRDTIAGGVTAVPLLSAFEASVDAGLTPEWYASNDCSGNQLGAPAASVEAADTSQKPAGTNSARLRGCVQVTESGPFRFFVALGKSGASARLTFEGVAEPAIAASAEHDGEEVEGEIALNAGVPYPFTLELHTLGGGDASMVVEGESLAKGSLARLTLYPRSVFDRVAHADVVLAKVLRLISGFALDPREVGYLLSHGRDFSELDLSTLPAVETWTNVATRFAPLMRLAGYAALKRSLALEGGELIEIFESARRKLKGGGTPAAAQLERETLEREVVEEAYSRVAALTRREVATVKRTAEALGFKPELAEPVLGTRVVQVAGCTQEQGLRRLWDALAMLEALGTDAEAAARWGHIVDPLPAGLGTLPSYVQQRGAIADEVKNTVKARFEGNAWYAIAQPTFDALRKRKRDALVAHIMNEKGWDSADRIYEEFLLDPETEPVVQTSRVELAISSVQLFVQRCLLNLEERVPPVAIVESADWEWMKRYRYWEANRRIFLYPENWLEPEFRDDRTSLFKELEGSLLQGDVTTEAAEDAFLGYLQELESIARLQIVSMYVEEGLSVQSDILHVIGRTYAAPHKYYYRRMRSGEWSPWEPVGLEIDGDHVVAVKWNDRLHLFWVTFAEKQSSTTAGKTTKDLGDQEPASTVQKLVEARLSWSAYTNGTWTARSSSPPFVTIEAEVGQDFDRDWVAIFVSKETTVNEETKGVVDGAVCIDLRGELNYRFRIATKNSTPTVEPSAEQEPPSYYSTSGSNATLRRGTQELSLERRADNLGPGYGEANNAVWPILGAAVGAWELLLDDANPSVPTPELAPLEAPFFFEDDENTFFVVPEAVEETILEWERFGLSEWIELPLSGVQAELPERVTVTSQVPGGVPGPTPDPRSKFQLASTQDWVSDPHTVIQFNGSYIGEHGGVGLRESGGLPVGGNRVGLGVGSSSGPGAAPVSGGGAGTAALAPPASLLIIGPAGLSGAALSRLANDGPARLTTGRLC